MHVALLQAQNTRQAFPPLNILSIGGFLEKQGIQVTLFDILPNTQDILDLEVDLIGIGALTPEIYRAISFAWQIKKEINIPIILGGPHISLTRYLPEPFDIGVVGEGEIPLLNIISLLADKNSNLNALANVPGLLLRDRNKVVENVNMTSSHSLDSLPFPARHLIDFVQYLKPQVIYSTVKGRGTSIYTSRGCNRTCDFCVCHSLFPIIKWRSAERIFEELAFLRDQWNIQHVFVVDDQFVINFSRLQHLANLIQGEELPSLGVLSRVENLTPKYLKQLHRLNCKSISIGLETADVDDFLKMNKHHITFDEAEKRIIYAAEEGFDIDICLMIGFPGQTFLGGLRSLEKALELPISKFNHYLATPYPGTKWFDLYMNFYKHLLHIPFETFVPKEFIPGRPNISGTMTDKDLYALWEKYNDARKKFFEQ